ncbi:MAG TPA: DUF885 domain-containing protein [Steroidobacteraceae bacterium]|nr:DUF885 domain-containing protein [Steroidobacteraceae bacterium]
MRKVGKVVAWGFGLAAAGLVAASMWFWFTPVGLNNYVNKITVQLTFDSPEIMSQLGFIDNTPLDFHSGKLDDYTREHEERTLARLRKARAGLDAYGPDGLDGKELTTWKVTAWFLDDLIRQAEFEHAGYRVNQISGPTVSTPQFLTDTHVIKDERSVERYLARVQEFGRVLREIKVRVEDDRDHGIVPPDFVIDQSLTGMRAFIEGGAAKNALVTTLPDRLAKVESFDDAQRRDSLRRAEELVAREVIPGYEAMIELFESMRPTATHDAGIWRIPRGSEYYATLLRSNTTTDLDAEEIHALGLSEVARIEAEMTAILDAQGVPGASLADRIGAVSADPAQRFTNDAGGRAQMLAYLDEVDDRVMAAAPKFFKTIPPQPLEIVRVPEYSQDSAPGGYYNPPALDGSRPGRFYINQKDTADNPRWTLATLMIHEGAPGHHFQLSAQQLIEGVPVLRKVLPFSAYSEGWALYAERLAKTDMGMYASDPFGDLGRLQAEMYRAVRLVVDTGMHARQWSREQSIDYMVSKTGMTESEVTREIERYVVWPGQATSYKVGQLAFLRMREEAEKALGPKFDLREFHEVVLMNGAMPLALVEETVRAWIDAQQGDATSDA